MGKNEQQQISFVQAASELIEAEKISKLVPRWTSIYPSLTETDGYQILEHYVKQFQQEGEKIIGYKLAYTSEPMRKQMGISTPCYGYIFERHLTNTVHDHYWKKWVHPKMEPELAVTLKNDVRHPLSTSEWEQVIDHIYLIAEVVDSRYEHYQFELPDIIADNNSIAAVLWSEQQQLTFSEFSNDLSACIKSDHKIIEEGSTQSVMGHPLNALNWLIQKLAEHDQFLQKGELIITGGLTKAVDIHPKNEFTIELFDQDRLIREISVNPK